MLANTPSILAFVVVVSKITNDLVFFSVCWNAACYVK